MLVSEFNYQLPSELIAQEPLCDRAASRLLKIDRSKGSLPHDGTFRDFPEMLRADDLLVLNNTRVFPARLYGRRSGAKSEPVSSRNPSASDFLKGQIEVLLTRQVSQAPNEWECLVRPGRKIGVGERLFFGDNELEAEVISRGGFGVLERLGHIPLPPYVSRADLPNDRERYQTVYAQATGSVAAPTAGLHFTPEILAGIRNRGIEMAEITLHVGLGTFQPVRVERVEDHRLHTEPYEISTEAAKAINRALHDRRRLVAVGTTTVRTLEYAAGQSGDGTVEAGRGEADLFIYPGYQFRAVGALLTNFHLPQSSLLMLVCAFGGLEPVMQAYRQAVDQKYRFYSYGDCMFIG